MDAVCAAMDFTQTVTDVIAIRLVPRRSEFLAADAWHVEVVREDIERNIARSIVRIGKEPDRDIDYGVHGTGDHGAFARRLREKLHLRERFVDGVREFSVV